MHDFQLTTEEPRNTPDPRGLFYSNLDSLLRVTNKPKEDSGGGGNTGGFDVKNFIIDGSGNVKRFRQKKYSE